MDRSFKYLFIAFFFCISCNQADKKPINDNTTIVNVEVSNGYNQWIYLEKLAVFNSGGAMVDSVFVKNRVENVVFRLGGTEESLYKLYSKDHRIDIVFVGTPGNIQLKADYFDNGKFEFLQSPTNISLHRFLEEVKHRAEKTRQMSEQRLPDSLLQKELENLQNDYRNFVDSVSSPAAALYVYNAVDFGRDREGLKQFVTRLSKRFPLHTGIKLLTEDVKSFLAIYDEELKVGDQIPSLTLFNRNGLMQPVIPEAKYTLIEFWASWDGPSKIQMETSRQAYSRFKDKGFSVISVSLDPEPAEWKKYLDAGRYEWKQFIDDKVWTGAAVRAYKFDSIPFNFLVDQTGKIIDKALYGGALLKRLESIKK